MPCKTVEPSKLDTFRILDGRQLREGSLSPLVRLAHEKHDGEHQGKRHELEVELGVDAAVLVQRVEDLRGNKSGRGDANQYEGQMSTRRE